MTFYQVCKCISKTANYMTLFGDNNKSLEGFECEVQALCPTSWTVPELLTFLF